MSATTLWDRAFGAVLTGVAGLYALDARTIRVPFQYEPLGPTAFPLLLAAVLATTGALLVARPDRVRWFASRDQAFRVGAGAVVMGVYAALFVPLGFMISTALMTFAMARLFGMPATKAALYGVALAVVGYFGIAEALGLNVPFGDIFRS
ncbi:tripartite tricarboxylate transporter TctB family protein [Salinarimonas sp.]|uniref:tripartite tricarboxylate transporter TctB family protein n=1 Tax=Salinarimonas sp. TaxID=2766526 RepID=UPI0032D9015C